MKINKTITSNMKTVENENGLIFVSKFFMVN